MRRALAALILALAAVGISLATAAQAPSAAAVVTQPTKVLYVGFENMSRTKAFGGMAYLKSLAASYGEATHVSNPLDPSLPNYLEQTFGKDFGITDDGNPKHHPGLHGQTVYGNAVARGLTAHVYAQDMVGNCELFDDANGYYKVRHAGGLPYAADERALCNQILTPMASTFQPAIDAGALPNMGWLAPSNRNNAHRPSTPAQADAWLKATLPKIMAGPDYQAGALVIIVSTDEGSGSGATSSIVPFVVIHPSLSHVVVTDPLTETDLWHAFLRYGGSITSGPDDLTEFGL